MRATVDIDEALLCQAEQKARQQGQTLQSLLESALRKIVTEPSSSLLNATTAQEGETLEADDPFFAALEEIRSQGRSSSSRRTTNLS